MWRDFFPYAEIHGLDTFVGIDGWSNVWGNGKRWYEEKKHLRIRQDDPELGKVVHRIRAQKSFLQYADFAMWLWCDQIVHRAQAESEL